MSMEAIERAIRADIGENQKTIQENPSGSPEAESARRAIRKMKLLWAALEMSPEEAVNHLCDAPDGAPAAMQPADDQEALADE